MGRRPFQLPGIDPKMYSSPIIVLLDLENCGIPGDCYPADRLYCCLEDSLKARGFSGDVFVFAVAANYKNTPLETVRKLRKIRRFNVSILNREEEQASDVWLIEFLRLWACFYSASTANLMVVSGDRDFKRQLITLRNCGYSILQSSIPKSSGFVIRRIGHTYIS